MTINDTTRIPPPPARPLRVFALDPCAGRYVGNEMVALVRFEKFGQDAKPGQEKTLGRGPVGKRFAVIDYDGSRNVYYKPVDLDDPCIVMRQGLDPSESDPRFHQQMVYAVASETLQRFEVALGRRVHWAKFDKPKSRSKDKPKAAALRNLLFLFPHAMAEANAFYSREAQGIVFGYFRASTGDPGDNLPSQTVYSCLSHDIIAHETTHAILDGMRSFFTEPTNIDVPAFHEAFADISALFVHFSHRETLLDTLMKTGGRLYDEKLRSESTADADGPRLQTQIAQINPLAELALQFGEASGMKRGLRQMLGSKPNSNDITKLTEAHDRGAILVAAVFDAFFTIYTRRTADLFRIYRAGGGSADPVDLPEALACRLANEASRTAQEFFGICARAIDYCPPVDLEFGDFLRALMTAHTDLHPEDPDAVRSAFLEAFRLRGILPRDANSLTPDSVCWPQVVNTDDPSDPGYLPPLKGLIFGDPNGLTEDEKDINGEILREYARLNATKLGFPKDPDQKDNTSRLEVPSFHPIFRIGPHGNLFVDMVVELVRTETIEDPEVGDYLFRSGVTLLIWQEFLEKGERAMPRIHYIIPKHRSEERKTRQRSHFAAMLGSGRHDEDAHKKAAARGDLAAAWRINFGLLHTGL